MNDSISDPVLTRRSAVAFGAAVFGAIALSRVTGARGAAAVGAPATERFPVTRSAAEWKRLLTPDQYDVLREAGTEIANSSPLENEKRLGFFACAGCDLRAFDSRTKFDSGTGWPSFYRALPGAVASSHDASFMMDRTEIHCSRCGGHLGHLFDDGPKPTGLRYCMNGVALRFHPDSRA